MTAAINLAAGESNRLGQPKQILIFKSQTLLERAIDSAQRSNCSTVIVVLGANAGLINPIPGTSTLYNNHWQEGMATSIITGINEVNENPSIDKVIILLCDQPFLDADLLNLMIDKQSETGKPIVACHYNNTTGVPVLFDRSIFADLLLLKGAEGAKKILKNHTDQIATIPFERGSIDIDTPEDFEKLKELSD
jgi:molybdenum cofactor cytidylyltransferase